ncbi:MAG TPA: DUF423 domain-containing protein [Rhizomicrobium sp.]|nr:DUF423 domain-containing protein [Rhizomicrobium sp.]
MRTWLIIAALNGALAVALGAFAAHSLAASLDGRAFALFETGARYHMYHALALGLSALAMREEAARSAARWSAYAFLGGIVLFSGSLYAYALTAIHPLVYVTPFGGAAFLTGWVLLALAASRTKS